MTAIHSFHFDPNSYYILYSYPGKKILIQKERIKKREEERNKESQKITLSQGGTSLFPRSFTVWEGGGTLIERFFFSQEPCAPVLAIYPCFLLLLRSGAWQAQPKDPTFPQDSELK